MHVETAGHDGALSDGALPDAAVPDGAVHTSTPTARRERVRQLAVILPGVLLGMATLTSLGARYLTVRTTTLVPTFPVGDWILADLGSNLAVGALVSVAALAIGLGVWALTGARWAAGLLTGAALTLTGWALMTLGLLERPVRLVHDALERPTLANQEPFVIALERTAGFGLLLAVVALGLVTAAASVPHLSGDPGTRLNPWVASCGAAAMLGVAIGPLLPVGSATLGDNLSASADRPGLFLLGRGLHLLLLAGCGIGGFLLVRTAGLGLVLGALPLTVWMTLSALLDIGTTPIGVGVANPGRLPSTPGIGDVPGIDVHAMTAISTAALALFTAVALSLAVARGLTGAAPASPTARDAR